MLLTRYLRLERGADASYWGFNRHGAAAAWCHEHALPCHRFPAEWPRSAVGRAFLVARFALALRLARVDMLLGFVWFANVLGGLAWRPAGCRLFVWNQRDPGLTWGGISRWERHAARATPLFVSNSEHAVAGFLVRELGVGISRCRVLPNVVETAGPSAPATRRPGAPLRVAMIAHLTGRKDQRTLLAAWRRLRTSGAPDARLLLAGAEHETAPALHVYCAAHGLGDAVRFLGSVADVPALLGTLDLVVHSSNDEGMSNAILEAMAHGIPVLASDIPGNRELLGDHPELLFPHGDAKVLAERMAALLGDPRRRARLGARLAAQARQRHAPARLHARYADLLERSLAGCAEGAA